METGAAYKVKPARGPVPLDRGWEQAPWAGIEPLRLENAMGAAAPHRPTVEAKLLYDEEALHVAFRVRDRWVRSVVTAAQGPVCTDSCVELFFTPGEDVAAGYFNIEVNCGGTALFKHQRGRDVEVMPMTAGDIEALAIRHSMPRVVDPEISEPVEWFVGYRITYDVLSRRAAVQTPGAGVRWRANLYKCGDATSHPHWLTWAPVDWPKPDFHRPEFFGTLVFEA